MPEVLPKDILLRVGGRTLQRHGVLAVAGSRRALVDVPITFSRADAATCATYIDRDGILRLAAANVPRLEWVDLDGDGIRETPGLLLEGSRDNAWTHSEELNDGVWTKSNASVPTPNTFSGADGTQTSDRLIEDATAGVNHGFTRAPPAMTDNTKQSVAVCAGYVGSRTWFRIKTVNKANSQDSTWFNIAAGTVGTVGAGHTNVRMELVGPVGAQSYRCSLTFDSSSGATTPSIEFWLATGDNSGTYAGDGVSGMAFWGMEFATDKPFRSSYIKTVASAVTRAADGLTLPFNFGPFDTTVLYRLARPVWADASGDLGQFPEILNLGSATDPNARIESFFGQTTRNFRSRFGTSASDAAQNIPAGASLTFTAQHKNPATAPAVAVDAGSGLSAFDTGAPTFTSYFSQTARIGGSGASSVFGVVVDLLAARGLFSHAEMSAAP